VVSQPVRIAVLSLSGLIVVGLGILGLQQFRTDQAVAAAAARPEMPKVEAPATPAPPAPAAAPKKEIWVHVSGAVQKPGVYQLPEGARVAEALNAAGGSLPEGRPDELNLAEALADGAKIWVPTEAELKAAVAASSAPPVASKGTVQPVRTTTGATGTLTAKARGKVNVNTASAKDLESVNGIGPSTAAKIVEYRQANGPFKSLDDLTKVKGIGPATLAKIREGLTV
jgi:competence protein ComEA